MKSAAATGDYNDGTIIWSAKCEAVRAQVGDKRVLLGLSGGVDSSVCAALLSRAIPGQPHLHLRRSRPHAQKRNRGGTRRVRTAAIWICVMR